MSTRTGGWLRVSTGAQDEDLQRRDLLRFAEANGLEIVKWYRAHAKSASKGEHDIDMSDALADTQAGEIRVLLATALDRVERRGIEAQFRIIRQFREAGGDIWSVLESPVNGKPLEDIGLTLATIADMNRRKSELARFNTRRGHEQIDSNGAFRGKVPFGYALEGPKYHRHLVPTELGQEWVPQIFRRVIDGYSLSEVCWWLDSMKLRYRKDGSLAPWWPATVMQLIRNPVYVGHYSADDGRWLHTCEPLVDPTTFRLANEALSSRHRKAKGPKGLPENRAQLRGALTCPLCGGPMHRNVSVNTRTSGGGHSKPYYRCRGTGPQAKGCGNNVSMAEVDQAIDHLIATYFRVPIMLHAMIRGRDHQAELDQVALELDQLPRRRLARAEEQAERERLWAEEDRLKALPVEEDHWELLPSGEVYAEEYARMSPCERGEWLAWHGFRITATKAEVTIQQGDIKATLPLPGGTGR
jgi:DNA invertase Pin-like site-specific DNA recombinase